MKRIYTILFPVCLGLAWPASEGVAQNSPVRQGSITVQVCQDGDDIVFYVRDNGVGMSDELIHAILEQGPEDRTGIGIRNVNDRLKIYFGKQYGLHITSEPDVGTCVEIRMPKIQEGNYEAK